MVTLDPRFSGAAPAAVAEAAPAAAASAANIPAPAFSSAGSLTARPTPDGRSHLLFIISPFSIAVAGGPTSCVLSSPLDICGGAGECRGATPNGAGGAHHQHKVTRQQAQQQEARWSDLCVI